MRKLRIFTSVGKSAKNSVNDVKLIQALINVYQRKHQLPVFAITGKCDELLEKAIADFQINHLKSSKADSRVDAGGSTFKSLLKLRNDTFKPTAISSPDYGIVTWESEGAEGGPYHSRKLHIPSEASGLTIVRGYDLRRKNEKTIRENLTSATVDKAYIDILVKAAGKFGKGAEDFVINNDLLDLQITPDMQKKLFKISYNHESQEVKRICEKKDVEKLYGKTDWDKLNSYIKDILIDLKFRGDYTSSARQIIQKSVADNDIVTFKKKIKDESHWKNVPSDRFKRRVSFIDKAPLPVSK